MLTAVRTRLSSVEFGSRIDFWEEISSIAVTEHGRDKRASPQVAPVDAEFAAISEMLEQLVRMNRASLRGYRDLHHSARGSLLETFLEVVIRERTAQCEGLERIYRKISRRVLGCDASEGSLANPSAAEMHVLWLRATRGYDHGLFGQLLDCADCAEILLEDACLTAAYTLPHTSLGALLQDHAIDICGSRQRLEELTYDLISESQRESA